MTRIDFNSYAHEYARNRTVQPKLLERILAQLAVEPRHHVLEVGCGTANYARAIARETGAELYGIDPHVAMIENATIDPDEARVHLREGSAEQIPFPDASFDALFSVDVIHHVENRPAYAAEAFRVLRPDGRLLTATDSAEDIRGRIPLSSHFPETVAPELARYPAIEEQMAELAAAGFAEITTDAVAYEYSLTDIAPYEARAFSALRLIDEGTWQRGVERLRADLERGPVIAVSSYTILTCRRL